MSRNIGTTVCAALTVLAVITACSSSTAREEVLVFPDGGGNGGGSGKSGAAGEGGTGGDGGGSGMAGTAASSGSSATDAATSDGEVIWPAECCTHDDCDAFDTPGQYPWYGYCAAGYCTASQAQLTTKPPDTPTCVDRYCLRYCVHCEAKVYGECHTGSGRYGCYCF